MEQKVVVAGWGQVMQPKILDTPARDPMGLMKEASLRAERITASRTVLKNLDGIIIVKTVSRHYTDPARMLASNLGSHPKFTHVSGIGGNSPQMLINMAGGMIARNELDSILIAGAETYVQRDKNSKTVESALFRGIPDDYKGDDLIGSTPLENTHGIEHPMQGFPLFETALWAESGLDFETYMLKTGNMWSEFSRVASTNPYAWSRDFKTAGEILTLSRINRPVAFPYTKNMNSFVTVDQGAAVILMSEEKAEQYKQKKRQKVYFLGGGYAEDRQRFMIQKSDFTSSRPLKAAVDKALKRSGLSLENISCFDLYSCFPCAVSIAKKMIGIKDDDPRPLTLTGGLGFFGGPGNNYRLHSAATLAGLISTGEKSNGLITALGWFMHKHAAGVYSSKPLNGEFKNHDVSDQKELPEGEEPVKIQSRVNGDGRIETYTIIYKRNHEPAYGVIYGRTGDNLRFIANTEDDKEIFTRLSSKNRVGEKVNIKFNRKKNINIAQLV